MSFGSRRRQAHYRLSMIIYLFNISVKLSPVYTVRGSIRLAELVIYAFARNTQYGIISLLSI